MSKPRKERLKVSGMLGAKVIARAKLNLYLEVGPLMENGYHWVRSVMQTLELSDELYFRRTDGREGRIRIRCSERSIPTDDSNLVWRAVLAFEECTGVLDAGGIEAFINKKIPVGAGLAGGSADAAATIVALNYIYELGLGVEEMQRIGSRVGSDVPFCVSGGTALVSGRGENVEPLKPLPSYHVVLATSGRVSPTSEVYARFDGLGRGDIPPQEELEEQFGRLMEGIEGEKFELICANLHNSLEAAAVEKESIEMYKNVAKEAGASGVLMTGSGSAVYALADTLDRAIRIARKLEEVAPITIVTGFSDRGAELFI